MPTQTSLLYCLSRFPVWVFLLLPIIFLANCTTLQPPIADSKAVQKEREKQEDLAFALSVERVTRLSHIAFQVDSSNVELCKGDVEFQWGWNIHNAFVYGEESQARAIRAGLSEKLSVRSVSPNSPAANAGLQRNDIILAVNDKSFDSGDAEQNWNELNAVLVSFRENTTSQETSPKSMLPITVRFERAGTINNVEISAIPACEYMAFVVDSDVINASAGGGQIIITSGMMNFAKSDDELALVYGHEAAHLGQSHQAKKAAQGIPGAILDIGLAAFGIWTSGAFQKMGMQAGSQAYELEADYAGLYMTARAGYKINSAPLFWRRMGIEHPASREDHWAATHPSTPERFTVMEETVKEIQEKITANLPLLPEEQEFDGGNTEVDMNDDDY